MASWVFNPLPVIQMTQLSFLGMIPFSINFLVVATVTPPAAGFALVTAEGARLRVRAEANTDAAIVGWVQPGETVPVVEVSADGLWVKIGPMPDTQNPDGGWVSAEFLVLGQ